MDKQGEIYSTERPGIAERLASRLSIHSVTEEGLGGIPEFTTADFAAAVGSISDNLERIVLGAKIGNWTTDRFQLREIVTRRSWDLWRESHNQNNVNVVLNVRIANLVLSDFYLTDIQRKKVGDTSRAKLLKIDKTRFDAQISSHHQSLIKWMDTVESEALSKVYKALRKI